MDRLTGGQAAFQNKFNRLGDAVTAKKWKIYKYEICGNIL